MEDHEIINPGAEEAAQLDLDSVLAESEAPIAPPEMTAPAPVEPAAETPPAQTAQAAEQMVDMVWRGETIQKPLSSIVNMAQQAYDLDQRNREFREHKTSTEAELKQSESLVNRYKAIDDYAVNNPGWFDHVQEAYNRMQQGLPPEGYEADDPLVQQNQLLHKEMQELKQWKNNMESERASTEEIQADEAFKQTQQKVKDEFKDVNFEGTDESGYTLESRVLKYGLDNGLPFKSAFLEYYTPTLLKMAEEKGQRTASDAVKKSTEAGIISKSPGPRAPKPKRTDFSNISWDQLADEAVDEYGS